MKKYIDYTNYKQYLYDKQCKGTITDDEYQKKLEEYREKHKL